MIFYFRSQQTHFHRNPFYLIKLKTWQQIYKTHTKILMSQSKPEEILQNKENKIKMLFSEFETLKKKIMICEQQRRQETEIPRPQPRKRSEQHRQSLQPKKDDQKQILKLKLQKYEQLLRQKTEMFDDKQRYMKKALKQQKINLEHLRETYEAKLRRAAKLSMPFSVEDLVQKCSFGGDALDKLSLHEKRLAYLAEMVEELRRAFRLRAQRQDQEIEEMVKEKLALEVALAEKEDKIGDMQREIDKQPNEDVQLELREKLELIERQRKEEIGLLEEKLRELEEEVERLLQEKQRAKQGYQESISKLELEFRQQIKHYTKKQQQLEQAQRSAVQANKKLSNTLKHQRQTLQQIQMQLTQCRKQLQLIETQTQQLRLQKQTLERQTRLSSSTYQAQTYTLKAQLKQQTQSCQQLSAQIAQLEATVQDIEESKKSLEKKIEAMMKKNIEDERGAKENTLMMQNVEKQLKDALEKLAKEKNINTEMKEIWSQEKVQLGDKIEQLQGTITSKDELIQKINKEVERLNQEIKKQANVKTNPNTMPMQTRKQIEKYQSEISQLKIMLQASQQELESLRSKKDTLKEKPQAPTNAKELKELEDRNKELQAKNKTLADEKVALEKRIAENTIIIQQAHGKRRKLDEQLKQQDLKYKQIVQQLEQRDKIIEQLRQKKAGFESLAIEFGKGTDQLKKKHFIEPKSNQKRITSSINDFKMRVTKSDTSECVDERNEDLQQPVPITRTRTPTMLYSFNLSGQRQLLQKIKNLEKQLQLAHVQNMKREKMQQDLASMQMDQERILNQKQILKNEVNTLNHELTALKDSVRKLLALMLVDSKKAFKGNVTTLKEVAAKVFKMILPEGELALSHLFTTNLEDKKGIFSIL